MQIGNSSCGRHQKVIRKNLKKFRLPFVKKKKRIEDDEILIRHREGLVSDHASFRSSNSLQSA